MSTFKELQDEVLAHGFAESYRTRVKTWINIAQSRIARNLEVAEKFTSTSLATVSGTSVYNLPTNETVLHGIVDESIGFELQFIHDPDVLLATNAAGTYRGRPLEYAVGPTGIILSPVPDSAYTLTVLYYLRPTDMSADTDISTLPLDYHDCMVSFALQRAYRAEDDAQMAQFYQAEYDRDMKLLGADTAVQSTGPTQVRGTWDTT